MSNELLPCPFCGGEAEICHVTQLWEPRDSYWAKCGDCHTSGKHHKTEAEAIQAWNTRAATTIGQVAVEVVPTKRTCKGESDMSEWVCSECQCWIPTGITHENKKRVSAWNFCPHCGAKVVE